MHIIKHFITITRHRHKVMFYCFRCGLYRQGLAHDLSKYSLVEFINGAKFYNGTYSPHVNERAAKGYSAAWLHHKGKNKHHGEYWYDFNKELGEYAPVKMPNRYIGEMFCDRLAATKVYSKHGFSQDMPLEYFLKNRDLIIMHEDTKDKIEHLLRLYKDTNEKVVFKYIKKNLRNNNQ